jgi:hypothetical protein
MATWAKLSARMDDGDIKILGRWSSDAVKLYQESSTPHVAHLARMTIRPDNSVSSGVIPPTNAGRETIDGDSSPSIGVCVSSPSSTRSRQGATERFDTPEGNWAKPDFHTVVAVSDVQSTVLERCGRSYSVQKPLARNWIWMT